MIMDGKCIIVSAGSFTPMDLNYKEGDFLIACDAGFVHLQNMGILPDFILGDFDSLSRKSPIYLEQLKEIEEADPARVMHLNVKKDDTDTMQAVKLGLSKGYKKFYLYGSLGGSRFDHSISNIQTLLFIKHSGAKGYIMSADGMMLIAENETISFNRGMTGMFSVFSISDISVGVTIKGAMYGLENGIVKNDTPIGVSNEFIIDEQATVTVEKGTLLICVQWDNYL